MKHKHQRRSDCPINFSLEAFGDSWTLLIIRDIVYYGKKTYGDFLDSEEGIATNILADRLALLEQKGILERKRSEKDRRKEAFVLTERGLDLIPILVEMAGWGAAHDPQTQAPAAWIELVNSDKPRMIELIRQAVQSGRSVLAGQDSLVSQFF